MKKLIAKRPVLYMGRMYQAGDRLPAQEETMVAAWLNAGSAEWFGPEAEKDAENSQEPEMVTGYLEVEDLAGMKKSDLKDLAAKLGVDISKAKNNDERAALIAAVEVQAPEQENGGAQ